MPCHDSGQSLTPGHRFRRPILARDQLEGKNCDDLKKRKPAEADFRKVEFCFCDRLASELLMPRHLFLNAVGSSLSIENIFELAGVLDTSLSAAAIGCAELLGVSTFGTEGKVVSWAFG